MIAVAAVGPFTQQLVHYESRSIQIGGLASLPRTENYDAYAFGNIAAVKSMDLAMKASFYNGVFNGDHSASLAVSGSCSSGNCTWPDFSSVGVCSQCIDSTSSMNRDCQGEGREQSCTFTLPGGTTMAVSGQSMNPFFNSSATAKTDGLPSYNSTMFQLEMIANPGGPGSSGSDGIVARTCSLYFCVKTYQVWVESGNLTESIASTFPNEKTSSIDSKVVGTTQSSQGSGYPPLAFLPGSDDGVIGGPYNISGFSSVPMIGFLASNLQGSGSGMPGEASYDSDAVQVLSNSFGVTSNVTAEQVFENLATSWTNTMRTDSGSSGSTTIDGTVWTTETFVTVDWPWISLPAMIAVVVMLLLLLTVWQTYRARMESFKSESLPALFAGLTDAKRVESGRTTRDAEGMEKAAEGIQVMLRVKQSREGVEYCLT